MNSMERIGAVLGGGKPDRRAFTLTLSLYGARLTGQDTGKYFSDPALYAAGQRAVVDMCEPDVLFGPFALALEAKAYGATIAQLPDSPPTVSRPVLKSAKEIVDLSLPDVEADVNLRFLVESVQAVVADQGGKRPVAAPIASPADLPILLMGMENWLQVLLFEPELAEAWSKLALDHFEALAAAYFRAGGYTGHDGQPGTGGCRYVKTADRAPAQGGLFTPGWTHSVPPWGQPNIQVHRQPQRSAEPCRICGGRG